jgi:hypothetical protein
VTKRPTRIGTGGIDERTPSASAARQHARLPKGVPACRECPRAREQHGQARRRKQEA